jgi:hypothetical protein
MERILTTHVASLVRPPGLVDLWAKLQPLTEGAALASRQC